PSPSDQFSGRCTAFHRALTLGESAETTAALGKPAAHGDKPRQTTQNHRDPRKPTELPRALPSASGQRLIRTPAKFFLPRRMTSHFPWSRSESAGFHSSSVMRSLFT